MNLAMPAMDRQQREIPLSSKLVIVLGGRMAFFGWLFFGIGLFAVLMFGDSIDWTSTLKFRAGLESTPGIFMSSEQTHFSEGGNKHHPRTPIYACRYRFTYKGREYSNTSYTPSKGAPNARVVTVEFPQGEPDCSRIQGMRCAPLGLSTALVFIFPAIGLAIILYGIWSGLKGLRLLTRGELGMGRLVSKEATNRSVGKGMNRRRVYELGFEFTDLSGELRRTTVCTAYTGNLEDDIYERIFYDPQKPERAILFDSLPGNQTFDEEGVLRPSGVGQVLLVVLPPLLGLAIFLAGVWLKL